MAKYAEGAGAVAEALGDVGRRALFEEVGTQGLVLALTRRAWLAEEAVELCYVVWCSGRHESHDESWRLAGQASAAIECDFMHKIQ
jgi:hypothetical protein